MDATTFEARAVQRHLRRAPRKVRLLADAVRGNELNTALNKLKFTNKGSSLELSKVIKSAAANLKDKFQEERFNDEDLYIKTIFVDEGITLKRMQPRAQGRAGRINKRSCHITVVVAKRETENATN